MPESNPFAELWEHDPRVSYLNHAAFGACPRAVLAEQARLRQRMERGIWNFLIRDLEPLLDSARNTLAKFIGAEPANLVFTSNATAAANAVLRSLWAAGKFNSGSEILVTNHTYNSCREAVEYVARGAGAHVVEAEIPFPCSYLSPDMIEQSVLSRVTDRTRLVVLDHVTSPTALLFATPRLIDELNRRGIDTLVDGAHAAGTIDLNVSAMDATYYFGACHKWLCGPKGVGYLVVQPERQEMIRPLAIGARAAVKRADRSRYLLEFDWAGTTDPTPMLCVGTAIDFLGSLLPGGWPELRQRNHALAVAARALLCEAWNIRPPCPDSMISSFFTLPLADGPTRPAQVAMWESHQIEAQLFPWPAAPRRMFRGSAQLYNTLAEYQNLAKVLPSAAGVLTGGGR